MMLDEELDKDNAYRQATDRPIEDDNRTAVGQVVRSYYRILHAVLSLMPAEIKEDKVHIYSNSFFSACFSSLCQRLVVHSYLDRECNPHTEVLNMLFLFLYFDFVFSCQKSLLQASSAVDPK
jgi:hypothetical protein